MSITEKISHAAEKLWSEEHPSEGDGKIGFPN